MVNLFWRIIALASAIGSPELGANVVLALFNVGVVKVLEESAEGLLEVEGKRRIVLEEGLGLYDKEDTFDGVLRFKMGSARDGCSWGCNCGCRCGSGCLVDGSTVAVGTAREV